MFKIKIKSDDVEKSQVKFRIVSPRIGGIVFYLLGYRKKDPRSKVIKVEARFEAQQVTRFNI